MAEQPPPVYGSYGWSCPPPAEKTAPQEPSYPGMTGAAAAAGDVMVYTNPEVPASEAPPPYPATTPDVPPPSYESLFGKAKAVKESTSGIAEFMTKFLEVACVACVGSVAFSVVYGLLLALPIAMIVIGAKFVYDCPAERYIPIYLIVGGASWLIWQAYVWKPCRKKIKSGSTEEAATSGQAEEGGVTPGIPPVLEPTAPQLPTSKEGAQPSDGTNSPGKKHKKSKKKKDDSDSVTCSETTLVCFIIAWFIAGNVWIYRTVPFWQGEDPTSPDSYCHPTVFYFSFWLVTGTYIVLAVVITCMSAFNICK